MSLAYDGPGDPGQPAQTDIGNFRVVNVSSAQLRVTVDYVFLGTETTGPVSIHATPEEAGGVFDPRVVEFEEVPVQTGRQTVSLLITKRNDARDFTSVAIRVCMSTVDYRISAAFFKSDPAHRVISCSAGSTRIVGNFRILGPVPDG